MSTDDIRAVLFDVDGTLYQQRPVRAAMAWELAQEARRHPAAALRTIRLLSAFRRIRERLRDGHGIVGPLDDEQYARCAAHTGIGHDEVRAVVDEWIMRRPLRHLLGARRRGLTALLPRLAARGVRIGALSDYPVAAKLDALHVAEHFSLRLCTVDPAINAFKPHPAGVRRACEIWGLAPREILYVGDRSEIDGAAAAAAGARCVIIGGARGRRDRTQRGRDARVRDFDALARALVAS